MIWTGTAELRKAWARQGAVVVLGALVVALLLIVAAPGQAKTAHPRPAAHRAHGAHRSGAKRKPRKAKIKVVPPPPAVQLLAASPHVTSDDLPGNGIGDRVTISPNGDGVNDAATVAVCARPSSAVELRVFSWLHGSSWTELADNVGAASNLHAGCVAHRAAATLVWNGTLVDGTPAPDGPYLVTACIVAKNMLAQQRAGAPTRAAFTKERAARIGTSAFHQALRAPEDAHDDDDETGVASQPQSRAASAASAPARKGYFVHEAAQPKAGVFPRGKGFPACLGSPVEVHVRRLSAAVASDGGFAPGAVVPLYVDSDTAALTATIESDSASGLAPLTAAQPIPVGTSQLQLPMDMAPGLYRVVVADAYGDTRSVPLVVDNPSFPVSAPPAGCALVVWPYLTWRAYNRYDADRNGIADTWYEDWRQTDVSLTGPYENDLDYVSGGLLPGTESDSAFTAPFANWLQQEPGGCVQMVTDVELGQMTPAELQQYALLAFPGHTEYYEPATYDLLMNYRNAGGHLLFLSSNNFFRTVSLNAARNQVTLTAAVARSAARSDYALVGVGYHADTVGTPFSVAPDSAAVALAFAKTGLQAGYSFSSAAVEVDAPDPVLSPLSLVPLAIAGPSPDGLLSAAGAVMALTSFPGGGSVFASGSMTFVNSLDPRDAAGAPAIQMLDNLWAADLAPNP